MGRNLKDEVKWEFSCFGTNSSADDKLCGFRGSAKDDNVRVYSQKNSGKIIPLSHDGLSFYHTAVPRDKNFTLKAKMHINDWSFTNGQEGFGIMACDRTGEVGEHDFWNNSLMVLVTKGICCYGADHSSGKNVPDENKVMMFQGVSAIARYGVTNDNLQEFRDDPAGAMSRYFFQDQTMLDDSCVKLGAGTYNIAANCVQPHEFDESKMGPKDYGIGNLMAGAGDNTPSELVYEDFIFSIIKDNSGYTLTYESADGKYKGSRTYFDPKYYKDGAIRADLDVAASECGMLEKMDSRQVYVGFFAARNADVSFSDIVLEIRDTSEDLPTREHDKVLFDNTSGFVSAGTANHEDYALTYRPCWNGFLKVTCDDEQVFEGEVFADENKYIPVRLKRGINVFKAEFTPDKNYHYGFDSSHPENIYNCLSSYDTVHQEFTVEYRVYPFKTLYVSPEGREGAAGSETDPIDLYTAVKFAASGQEVLLKSGIYELSHRLSIEKGIDGTAEKPVVMRGDGKVILDFKNMDGAGRLSGGFFISCSYWHISDMEICNTPDRNTGIWLSGHHNVLERLQAHHNGNVGICILAKNTEVRRDEKDMAGQLLWPHHNEIRYCLSFENCDSGGDLADGFACKLMAGEGNVFSNCVSYNNADDGFDLYTKSETGSIGQVRLENCVAYENGYVHRNGKLRSAGNGNGFKLGGESIPGNHTVTGSVAFKNKADGFDSNRCPDPKLYDCLAYDNEKSNYDLYSAKGKATDFYMERCVSFRTDRNVGRGDIIKCGGDQKLEDVMGEGVLLWRLNEDQ